VDSIGKRTTSALPVNIYFAHLKIGYC